MSVRSNRRRFLQTVAAGTAFLGQLPTVRADEAKPDPERVRLSSDTEPLVRLIESTPRDRLLEEVGSQIRKGASYRDVLTGLLLAGVRNIRPRPNVGFKFHAVLVVHSAHQASLAAHDSERWLPLFWALDNFKAAQATNAKESGWAMKPVDEGRVPNAPKAAAEFASAMDAWDEQRADAAAAAVARALTPHEAFELFAKVGARDFRDIGHKAIYVANAFRTLQTVGWQHAEPVLRSLAYAILKNDGTNPATNDLAPDRPGRRNRELADRLRIANDGAAAQMGVTLEMLTALRTLPEPDVGKHVADALQRGTATPRDVWDACFLAAGELLLRQPGIVALHAMTSANALHYAAETTADAAMRRWLMLQTTSFVTLFRDECQKRGKMAETRIDEMPAEAKVDSLDDVFATVGKDKPLAARMALGYLNGGGSATALTDAARRLVFFKGTDSHDYKFCAAVLEDVPRMAPGLRERVLAAAMMQFRGSSAADTPLVERTRAAVKG